MRISAILFSAFLGLQVRRSGKQVTNIETANAIEAIGCWLAPVQHFEAPDGCTGSFAWMCGYSADAAFMNDAAFPVHSFHRVITS